MSCPWVGDVVQAAIRKCPFLEQLAEDHGEDYARSVAVNPGRPAREPVFPESLSDFKSSFHLFHGVSGVVPLVRSEQPAGQQLARCPFQHSVSTADTAASSLTTPSVQEDRLELPVAVRQSDRKVDLLAAAPFASASAGILRFLPGPGDFMARRRRKRQERRDRRSEQRDHRAKQQRAAASQATGASQHSSLERWRMHPVVGGLIPLSAAGRYACPPLIVAGRQAVARLKLVQLLRPQALPVKLLGVGGHCFAANVPCGAVREHTEKFSLGWFVAVHATVPFFAFMRKGVGMPKWAIAMTLAAAVAGQTLGAKLERYRLIIEADARSQKALEVSKRPAVQRLGLPKDQRDAGERGCPLLRTCEELSQPGNPLSHAANPFLDHGCHQQGISAA